MAKNSRKEQSATPFAEAIEKRDRRKAIRLAMNDPAVLDEKLPSCHGFERALHAAVRLKSLELAQLALDHGMDVDVHDGGGYTPLFLAPELYSRIQMVELLVEHGADIHFMDDGPLWSAIWQASYGYGNTLPMVHFLASQGSKPRGLCHSAEAGNLKIAKLVVELGADVNEIDEQGFAPLDYCSGFANTWQFKEPQIRPRLAAYLKSQGALNARELQ